MPETKLAPPSKYQPEVDKLMTELKADAVFLVVFGGTRGSGCASTVEARLTHKLGVLLTEIGSDLILDPSANVSSIYHKDE